MSRDLFRFGWNSYSQGINRARSWHRKSFASKEWGSANRYRVSSIGAVRNPMRKPLLHKGRKP